MMGMTIPQTILWNFHPRVSPQSFGTNFIEKKLYILNLKVNLRLYGVVGKSYNFVLGGSSLRVNPWSIFLKIYVKFYVI